MVELPRRAALLAAGAVLTAAAAPNDQAVWQFRMPSLDGGELDFAQFRGRVLLVANTASFCGYTPQYAALQALHDRFQSRGLTVVGVPSDDFLQESKDNAAIKEFCDGTYGITFPMTTLSPVSGGNAAPLFKFLAQHAGAAPQWNFTKFLVGRDGSSVTMFPSGIAPDSPPMLAAVEKALG